MSSATVVTLDCRQERFIRPINMRLRRRRNGRIVIHNGHGVHFGLLGGRLCSCATDLLLGGTDRPRTQRLVFVYRHTQHSILDTFVARPVCVLRWRPNEGVRGGVALALSARSSCSASAKSFELG